VNLNSLKNSRKKILVIFLTNLKKKLYNTISFSNEFSIINHVIKNIETISTE